MNHETNHETDNEVHNDDMPVGRILNRRELLALVGAAGIVTLVGCGGGSSTTSTTGATGTTSTTTSGVTSTGAASETGSGGTTTTSGGSGTTSSGSMNVVVTPAVTEGPFFVDENLNRSNLVTGTTRASVINGLPLILNVSAYTISNSVATPLSGAHIDIWHADAIGTYSDESNGGIQSENTKGQTWLRGYQVTDANGAVSVTTIYPGWYQGRAIHIHFKVRTYDASGNKTHEFTSQFFIDDTLSDTVLANAPYNTRGTRQVRNANDSVYSAKETDGTTVGSHLMLTLTKNSSGSGYTGAFSIGLVLS